MHQPVCSVSLHRMSHEHNKFFFLYPLTFVFIVILSATAKTCGQSITEACRGPSLAFRMPTRSTPPVSPQKTASTILKKEWHRAI